MLEDGEDKDARDGRVKPEGDGGLSEEEGCRAEELWEVN